jgi:hypothetical protein
MTLEEGGTETVGPAKRRRWPLVVGAAGAAALIVAAALFWPLVIGTTKHHELSTYEVTGDGRTVRAVYQHGHCELLRKHEIVEQSPTRVVLTVVYRQDPGVCILIGYVAVATFTLDEPLGDRPVFADNGDDQLTPMTETDRLPRSLTSE